MFYIFFFIAIRSMHAFRRLWPSAAKDINLILLFRKNSKLCLPLLLPSHFSTYSLLNLYDIFRRTEKCLVLQTYDFTLLFRGSMFFSKPCGCTSYSCLECGYLLLTVSFSLWYFCLDWYFYTRNSKGLQLKGLHFLSKISLPILLSCARGKTDAHKQNYQNRNNVQLLLCSLF